MASLIEIWLPMQGFRIGVMRQIIDQSSADSTFMSLFNDALGDLAAAGEPAHAASLSVFHIHILLQPPGMSVAALLPGRMQAPQVHMLMPGMC